MNNGRWGYFFFLSFSSFFSPRSILGYIENMEEKEGKNFRLLIIEKNRGKKEGKIDGLSTLSV